MAKQIYLRILSGIVAAMLVATSALADPTQEVNGRIDDETKGTGAKVQPRTDSDSITDGQPDSATDIQLLVKPNAAMVEADLHAMLSSEGGRHHHSLGNLNVRVIRVSSAAAARLLNKLREHPDVAYAEPDYSAEAFKTASDPYFTGGSEWHLTKIQAPAAWDLTTGSSSVVVAVVDTGVNASHADLTGKVLTTGYDFVNNGTDTSDWNGHGTAVAGVIAPASNNALGVAGVAWANPILPIRVLAADGSGTYSAIASGIIYAADHGAKIINLSLGGTASSQTLQDAVNYAWSKQCVIVAAAGNAGNSTLVYPAACTNVVAVSATNSSDGIPTWSSYGSYVSLAAPGDSIVTLYGTNQYAAWSGTSFSSPVTSGVLALMASANTALSNTQLVSLLLQNCDDLGAAGYDVNYGYGRINAYRAVGAAKNYLVADKTAPVAKITLPTTSTAATVSRTISVKVSATDNVAVSRLELYVDALLVGQATGASATVSINTVNFINGSHSLVARAFDAAGNVGTATVAITVKNAVPDTTPPTAKITSPTTGTKITSTATTLKVSVTGADNVGVTKLTLYIDGLLFGTSASASTTFSWSVSKIATGTHTLQAFAYDAAGSSGASAVVTVTK